jgi:hypothetical protein
VHQAAFHKLRQDVCWGLQLQLGQGPQQGGEIWQRQVLDPATQQQSDRRHSDQYMLGAVG